MRKLAAAGALLVLALGIQGCSDSDSRSPTEPGGQQARGNWIGTITGTHAGLQLQGTCDLEMLLDPNLSGRWWIDCPNGASSQGQVIGASTEVVAVLVLLPLNPALNCPFTLVGNRTTATVEGSFEVTDCNTDAVVSTGAFRIRLR